MTIVTDGLEQIREIEKDIEGLENAAAEARTLVEKADGDIAERYANLRDVADALAGDFKLNGSPPATPAAKKRGRPAGAKVAVKKKRGRPPGSKNVKAGKAVKKAKAGKAVKSSPMLEACLTILGDRRKWRKFNSDLPTGADGLSVVELRRTIKGNEMWPEEGGTDAFSDAIKALKAEGRTERIENSRIRLIK